MIRHIFKLIWNRKRSLVWIFVEQLLIFGILLLCFTHLSNIITLHFSKGTVSVDNVIAVGLTQLDNSQEESEQEANEARFRNMLEQMKEWQSVDLISFGEVPGINFRSDSVTFNERRYLSYFKYCDENFYKMLSPVLSSGEWFRDSDASEIPPAIITQLLADNMGLSGNAIGQIIECRGRIYRITGVMEAFKNRADEKEYPTLFMPVPTEANKSFLIYAIKYKQGQRSDFMRAYVAEFYRNFPRDQFKPDTMDLDKLSSQASFLMFKFQIYMLGIPTAFLLIFAFMGTFGVVWMQSKKRISEMGLRIALGCTPALLQRTIILENLILTTMAMLPGLIVAVNLYVFSPKGWEWLAAVGAAILLMWLFSAFSAWYPARQASKVQPVEALKTNQ